ncbi:hypothetical protein [Stutzerimonas kirkiae]|uniref:hypothetical protein n=1 Tax=Stutzerimonas kirkiae TaxID=2211392 RepID=UPI001F610EC0|nr:hypothetical protein [Stutzerimonas kirkiae]
MTGAQPWRMLLCHKHPVSARLHFLVPQRAGVVLPLPLPSLAVFAEGPCDSPLQVHPASALRNVQEELGIGPALELVSEFQVSLEVPGMRLPVYLAALPGHDLCLAPVGTHWIELSKSIGMPWLDRELLRRAYEVLIG